MAGRGEPGLALRLAIGGIAGAAATLAFASTVRKLRPSAAGRTGGASADLSLADFACGAAFGALLAAANPRVGRIAGAVAGGGLWLASEFGVLPALTIRPARGAAPRDAALLAGHVVWGWSTAQAIRSATDAYVLIGDA